MKMKNKILVTARWPVGGIRTYFRYIYSQPCFDEFAFTFLMPDHSQVKDYLEKHCPDLCLEFIASEDSTVRLLRQTRRELATGGYCLVHSHGYTAGAVTSVALLGKAMPHLMTAHDVFLEGQFTGFKGQVKKLAMSSVFNQIDCIHAVSEDCKTNFLEFFPGLDSRRIETILHGVDTERFFSEPARDFRKELGLNDEFLFGFFGRFMAQKGFKFIVEAIGDLVAENPEYRSQVRVLTFGWGGFVREEFEFIASKGLSDVFVQMPHTDNMPAAIKGVDTVLMPSLWEACGLLGMEALSAGVPIIGTDCIGLREVLEGSPATVIASRDANALLAAIKEHLKKPRKAEFAEYAVVAKKRFSFDRPAQELCGLYGKLI